MSNEPRRAGRHFLQIPGPTPVPDRILRAMDMPVIDHRGPEFKKLGLRVLAGIKTIFKTTGPVVIYPSSGTGAWEAALRQHAVARRQGADVRDRALRHAVEDHRGEARPAAGVHRLRLAQRRRCGGDRGAPARTTRATPSRPCAWCTTRPRPAPSRASTRCAGPSMRARHPALLMVDTISSLASVDYRHDEWGVDVTVGGSQKGLMLPPGLGFNAVSQKALAASKAAKLPKSYFGLGRDAGLPTRTASSPTRPPPTCSTAWPRPSTCCTRRGSSACSPATSASPRACAARSRRGAWTSCARTRSTIRRC